MDDSGYIKVTVSAEKQLLCRVTSGVAYCPYQCEDCRLFTQTALSLLCGHYLCDECYAKCTEYICGQDKKLTRKEQAQRCNLLYDVTLTNTVIECPQCGSLQSYTMIADHIREKHPNLGKENFNCSAQGQMKSNLGASYGYSPIPNAWLTRRAPYYQGRGLPFNSDKSSVVAAQDIKKTIAPTITPVRRSPDDRYKSKKETEWRAGDRHSRDGRTAEGMPLVEYTLSTATAVRQAQAPCDVKRGVRTMADVTAAPLTSHAGGTAKFRLGEEDANSDWSKKTADTIRELQETAKNLDKKLDHIEKPLQMLIERLSLCY